MRHKRLVRCYSVTHMLYLNKTCNIQIRIIEERSLSRVELFLSRWDIALWICRVIHSRKTRELWVWVGERTHKQPRDNKNIQLWSRIKMLSIHFRRERGGGFCLSLRFFAKLKVKKTLFPSCFKSQLFHQDGNLYWHRRSGTYDHSFLRPPKSKTFCFSKTHGENEL